MENKSPIKFIINHFKVWFIAGVIASGIAFILTSSVFINPKYESETLVYIPHLAKKVQLLNYSGTVASQVEINTQIQLLKSTIILDSLIQKFELIEHYKIDIENPNWRSKSHEMLTSNIKIGKTKFGSISISVLDVDPVIAANMANAIVSFGNQVKLNIFKSNSLIAYDVAEQLYTDKLAEVGLLEFKFDSVVHSQKEIELEQNQTVIDDLNKSKQGIEKDLYASGNYSAYVNSSDMSQNYRGYVESQGNYKRDSVFALSLGELSGTEDSLYKLKVSQMRGEREKSTVYEKIVLDQEENLLKNKSLYDQIGRYENEIGELKKRYWKIQISDVPNRDRIEILKLRTQFENEIKELIERKNDLEKEMAIKETFAPKAFIVSKAFPVYKAASPKRVLISIGAFVFCSLLALLFVKVKEDGLGL